MTKIKFNQLFQNKLFNKTEKRDEIIFEYKYEMMPCIKINGIQYNTQQPIKYIVLLINPILQSHEIKLLSSERKTRLFLALDGWRMEDIVVEFEDL